MATDRRPRRRRALLLATLALLLGAGCAVLAGWPVAWPFDVVLNLGTAPLQPELRAPSDGTVRVVVLQHGLFRTSASLARLERTLVAHGYEVLNPGYASTNDTIEAHAERLAAALAARRAAGPVGAFAFVGHSMGGLVIQQYLRQPGAVEPWACVYLGTPHRGAVLCDLRKHWFLFRLAMGTTGALQLSPGDPLHRSPIPWPERSGTVVGDLGAGNASIPGDDDGTVAVGEATFAGAKEVLRLPLGHTRLSFDDRAIGAVLQFLHRGTFPPPPPSR
ncbi:MAG: esterase/lipase family protein [Planctomycetota bacterium]|jgi:triacylglycerol lipase